MEGEVDRIIKNKEMFIMYKMEHNAHVYSLIFQARNNGNILEHQSIIIDV